MRKVYRARPAVADRARAFKEVSRSFSMAIHDEICASIDRFKEQAVELGRKIHARPELKFEERFAAGLLTGALGEIGVEVERGVAGLETAFRAAAGKADRSCPTVAIL